jgi:hypothetical protein
MSRKQLSQSQPCAGQFKALVTRQPLIVTSVLARLTTRLELSEAPNHWIWKVIAEGKIGQTRTCIGLFIDQGLPLGTYEIPAEPRIKVIYNQTPRWKNIVYHSGNFQSGQLTLLEADVATRRLRGEFGFSISAIGFDVSDGAFDLHCEPC